MYYSHAIAFYLHNISDEIPLIYNVTVPYNYSSNLSNNEKYIFKMIF